MAAASPVPLPHPDGPLTGYRVLDFSDEKGQLAGRLMAEMGADVIKVEPRGGDPTRQNGPHFRDEPADNHSLYWWAMNAGKRSITLELKLETGRDLLRRLVAISDVVIETNKPGTAADLGLDYRSLSRVNPGIIVTSITNFGQTGPYRNMEATDIVGSAMGGHMYLNGDQERGPVRTTVPQAYAQANVQAAMGSAIALYARAVNDGVGQHVDVSMQEAMANAMDHAQQTWDIAGLNITGPGTGRNLAGIQRGRYLFESADGWVACLANGNMQGPRGGPVIDWLAEHGGAGDISSDRWRLKLATLEPLTPDETAYVEATLAAFCKRFPKLWLVEEAQKRGAGWAPVLSPREIVESEHLAARDYWVMVRHEDIGETFIYPGAPFKLGVSPWRQRGRAPHAGEHNAEVYGDLLGMDEPELRRARMRMVV
ncbi:MAG: CoA transferase [Dehalococcoidia bacterium]|nr:CoA transferase [Dehalococcoidia bacterium]MCA9846115.1 CoA transferase [Dehalococcoidia bacterium]